MSDHDNHDEWFHHDSSEGAAQSAHAEVVNIKALIIAFVAMTVFVLGLVGLLVVYFDYTATQIRVERTETTVVGAEARAYKAEQKSGLSQYGWAGTTEDDGVQLPVESAGGSDAMSKVVDTYSNGDG